MSGYVFYYFQRCVLLGLLAASVLWPAAGAGALENGKYTSAELVGFAFHTLAKFDPDFDKWIEDKEYLNSMHPIERVKATRATEQRLKNGYYNYNPDLDLIKIEVETRIMASNYYEVSQKAGAQTEVKFELKDAPNSFAGMYFPFELGDIWVAVVVKDLEELTNLSFNRHDYKEFATRLSLDRYGNTRSTTAYMDITLRPVSVDTDAPVELAGFEMWLMLAEVVHMEMWRRTNRGRDYLWEYRAPGYTPQKELELRSLYLE